MPPHHDPGPVCLSVDEATVILGVLDTHVDGTPIATLRRRVRELVASRLVETIKDDDEAVGTALRHRIRELEREHDRLTERFDSLRHRTNDLTKTTVELRRDAHDLRLVADAARRLVDGDGPVAARPADDPHLLAVRNALARLAA